MAIGVQLEDDDNPGLYSYSPMLHAYAIEQTKVEDLRERELEARDKRDLNVNGLTFRVTSTIGAC